MVTAQAYSEEVIVIKPKVSISVRNLVEFILRAGDLDNRRTGGMDNAMAEGNRIHKMIQRKMGSNYDAEVFLKTTISYETYEVEIEGRADGIITEEHAITVDEIKGTYKELRKIKEPFPVHLAQAKCYAYMYAAKHSLSEIRIRMTYCHLETEEIKYFHEEFTRKQLDNWFSDLMKQYKRWTDYEFAWREIRQASIQTMEFPFPYREGQKELVSYVYQTIYHKKKLFIEAPTGVGKTISTIFPTIKAMGKGMGEKVFYLTAKTITRTVANDCFDLLRNKGLQFKTIMLTAKDKICPLEEVKCNPVACPYAKGHYDRINDAMYDLLTNEVSYSRELMEEYGNKHKVCPFEMSLDMSLFADGIICDYNYLFDPHVYLKRFFGESIDKNYIFLIDEAHNLVERGRDMYSAVLVKEDFLELKRLVKGIDPKMEKQLDKCNKELLLLKKDCEEFCEMEEGNPWEKKSSIHKGKHQVLDMIDSFLNALNRLYATIDKYLEENADSDVRDKALDFYFATAHFLDIYERVDSNYVMYSGMESGGDFFVKLFCVNPRINLQECLSKGRSSMLFSATLLPIQYYKHLLGGDELDYEVYAKSTFDSEKRALLIAKDVTSKYSRRTELEFYQIAEYIHKIVKGKQGNYMVFFPSHFFLQAIYEIYTGAFSEDNDIECIVQKDYMSEKERELFLNQFVGNEDCDLEKVIHMEVEIEESRGLLGFCVLGGIFSEGIDLKEDSLIGAIIVGTGLPQVCYERELLRDFFDQREKGVSGFEYAYVYPGMNKVQQAAGRVIRTVSDRGVIALLDERFLGNSYQKLFPKEWDSYEVVDKNSISHVIDKFWNRQDK